MAPALVHGAGAGCYPQNCEAVTMLTATRSETVTVLRAKKFGGDKACRRVTWRDGRKRSVLVSLQSWTGADEAIADAVAACYPVGQRPRVIVPPNAWR